MRLIHLMHSGGPSSFSVDAGDRLCKDLLNLQVLSKQSVKSSKRHLFIATL